MAAIAPTTPAPATNFRCATRGLVAKLSRILILLLLLPHSKLKPNYFSRDAASIRLIRPVPGRPSDADPKECALQRRRLEAASGLRNETLPREAPQIQADGRRVLRRARTECLPARCPGNTQQRDKCLRAACGA